MKLRKAILTGSTKYSDSPLSFPEKDMRLMETTLIKRCSFDKSDITNIHHTVSYDDSSYLEKLKEICLKLESERTNTYDLIVFYYSGHGVYKATEQTSFLQISDDFDIPIGEIIETVSQVNARNKYFIIDACQSGGFSLMKPKSKINRQYSYNSQGVYCMFGTTQSQLAFEPSINDAIRKKIHNSFYTHFIAEALNTKSIYNDDTISIRVVDDYASKKTPTYTNFEQIPFSTTEIAGYFPFGTWTETKELNDISSWENKTEQPSEYYTNKEVDIVNYLHSKIQHFYSDDNSFLNFFDKELLSKLSQPAKDLLNEKLDLVSKKIDEKPLINGLITSDDYHKHRFLILILEQSSILIDVTLKDVFGNTALLDAIYNSKYSSQYVIEHLFIRGYKMSDVEESLLIESFKDSKTRPDHLENITLALICHKLSKPELILKSQKIIRVLFSFLSYKTKKVIGFKLNHTALANNFLEHHQEFSTIFLHALKEYGHYDELHKKPSFSKKEQTILSTLPFQETEYDDVFKIMFPELLNR